MLRGAARRASSAAAFALSPRPPSFFARSAHAVASPAAAAARATADASRPTRELTAAMVPLGGDGRVLVEELGCSRVAVLNRPEALNALDSSTVAQLHPLYASWGASPFVGAVLVRGAGGRAFCAGGDVKALVVGPGSQADKTAAAVEYFRQEDALVWRVATLPKPHVALLDGIVMGGGAGVSVNGAFRVATERSVFTMPEAAIGFFPDVGGTHFLNKLPGQLGTAVGLCGLRLKGRELRDAGVATHYIRSDTLPRALQRVSTLNAASASTHAAVSAALREFEAPELQEVRPAGSIMRHAASIDAWFAGDSVEDIVARLEAAAAAGAVSAGGGGSGGGGGGGGGGEKGDGVHTPRSLAAHLLANLRKASPTSLKVTLAALRRHRNQPLREVRGGGARVFLCLTCSGKRNPKKTSLSICLSNSRSHGASSQVLLEEFRMVVRFMEGTEFYEGVRSLLVDKDGAPRWSPSTLEAVSDEAVARYFLPLPDGVKELDLAPEPGSAPASAKRPAAAKQTRGKL